MIAALYVERGGVYYGLPDVDPWDLARDARLYAGPWPVVAHPPCARWCILAELVESQGGGKVGDDGGTFAAALAAVQKWGGVLEHPAFTKAWRAHGLPRPRRWTWLRRSGDLGWVTEVNQAAYGHCATKATWLYYLGDTRPAPMDWRNVRTNVRISPLSNHRGHDGGTWVGPVVRQDRGASARTPPAFRDALLSLARGARTPEAIREAERLREWERVGL